MHATPSKSRMTINVPARPKAREVTRKRSISGNSHKI
jgi:hypothetical protein